MGSLNVLDRTALQPVTFDQIIDEAGPAHNLAAKVGDVFNDNAFQTAAMLAPIEGLPVDASVMVLPNGEVVGRFFAAGSCILGTSEAEGNCWSPPPDVYGYNNYHQGSSIVDIGGQQTRVPSGGLVNGHAPPDSSDAAAIEHYNDVTLSVIQARAYDDDLGGYIHGYVVPGKTYSEIVLVEAAALSGHWIRQGREWVCIGPSLVGRPGLPLNRAASMAASVVSFGDAVERLQDLPAVAAAVRPYQVRDSDGLVRGWREGDNPDSISSYVGVMTTQVLEAPVVADSVVTVKPCTCQDTAAAVDVPPVELPPVELPPVEVKAMEDQILEPLEPATEPEPDTEPEEEPAPAATDPELIDAVHTNKADIDWLKEQATATAERLEQFIADYAMDKAERTELSDLPDDDEPSEAS